MLPSVPGYWGLWEAGGIYGLMLFGVPRVEAAGLTLAFHVYQLVPVVLLGFLSAWIIGIGLIRSGLAYEAGPSPHDDPEDEQKG